MNLTFTPSAWDHCQWFVQHDRKRVKRINQLIQDILRAPFEGIGKPEPLKGDLSAYLVATCQRRTSFGLHGKGRQFNRHRVPLPYGT